MEWRFNPVKRVIVSAGRFESNNPSITFWRDVSESHFLSATTLSLASASFMRKPKLSANSIRACGPLAHIVPHHHPIQFFTVCSFIPKTWAIVSLLRPFVNRRSTSRARVGTRMNSQLLAISPEGNRLIPRKAKVHIISTILSAAFEDWSELLALAEHTKAIAL
jgi:hypothetical protein